MKKRDFIKSIGLGIAGSATIGQLFFPNIVSSKKKHTWVAVSAFDKAGILGRSFSRICDEITRISNGELNIRLFHANELVSAFESFDVVQSGTCQMGFGSPYYWAGKSPSISLLSGIPFGMNYQEMSSWFYNGDGIKFADEIYNQFNLKFFPAGNTGNQMGGWFNKKIVTPSDFKGLKFRMPGLGGEVLKSFGTNVVLLPGPDVVPAISSGTIDGTEWIGPAADLGKGLHKVCKYYYYPGWHEPGPMLELLINIDAWNSLPNHLQVIIETATKAVNQDMLDEYLAKNNQALTELLEVHGVELRRLPDDVIEEFREISNKILDDLAKEDETIAKVYESYLNFKNNVSAYHEISEDAFVESRNK